MAKVLVPLAEGFEEIEAVSIIDIMRRGGIDVDIAYLGGKFSSDLVTGANGIVVQAQLDIELASSDDYDMIVLPGGNGGTNRLAQNAKVLSLLQEFKETNKWIGAICAAPFVLHKAGVLSYHYTCYPPVKEQIRDEGYTDKEKVVVDGKVMTSRGPGTAICFGLEIIKVLVGDEAYEGVKKGTLSDFC